MVVFDSSVMNNHLCLCVIHIPSSFVVIIVVPYWSVFDASFKDIHLCSLSSIYHYWCSLSCDESSIVFRWFLHLYHHWCKYKFVWYFHYMDMKSNALNTKWKSNQSETPQDVLDFNSWTFNSIIFYKIFMVFAIWKSTEAIKIFMVLTISKYSILPIILSIETLQNSYISQSIYHFWCL